MARRRPRGNLPPVGKTHTPEPGETEFTGVMGPAGVPKYKKPGAVTPSEQARLVRLTGTLDPKAPVSDRVWNGEDVKPNARQREGMKHE